VSADASELVPVGRVGRPHGLHGAFVVEGASDAPERVAVGARVLVDGVPAIVRESKRAGAGRLVVQLDRRPERGATLAVPRSELPPPEPDSFYVFQLAGLPVEEQGGRALGHVRDVLPGPANDVLELDTGLLLPLVEDCVLEVDLDAGRVLVARGYAAPE
jgi:16S rRNA processing protein RimM